jgi:hypothetical protein
MMMLVKYFVIKGMLLMMTTQKVSEKFDVDITIPLEQKEELDKLFD